jgi:secreted trypsin-like serine protease
MSDNVVVSAGLLNVLQSNERWEKMKKLLKLGSMVALVAFAVSVLGGQPAEAIVGGNNALQQYGAVSLWHPGPPAPGPNRHRCTASLISEYWAVTSAHCQQILIPGQTQVRASSMDTTSSQVEEVGLAAVYIHPGYIAGTDTQSAKNDMALIRFQRRVQHTQPLALSGVSPALNTNGKAAGWGWTCDDLTNPNCPQVTTILQELTAKVVGDAKCDYMADPQNQFCGVAASGANAMTCYGDSGGPFVQKDFNQWVLKGVNYGDGNTNIDHNFPCSTSPDGSQGSGIWVDVSKYLTWIQDTIYAQGGRSQLPQVVRVQ